MLCAARVMHSVLAVRLRPVVRYNLDMGKNYDEITPELAA
jgi:hypothetical protein